jgi:hypothetical protein
VSPRAIPIAPVECKGSFRQRESSALACGEVKPAERTAVLQDLGTWLRGLVYAKRAAVGPLRGLLSPGDLRGKEGRSTGFTLRVQLPSPASRGFASQSSRSSTSGACWRAWLIPCRYQRREPERTLATAFLLVSYRRDPTALRTIACTRTLDCCLPALPLRSLPYKCR